MSVYSAAPGGASSSRSPGLETGSTSGVAAGTPARPAGTAGAPMPRNAALGAVIRVTSGNFLEMFDFFLYGFYALSISQAFFRRTANTSR